MVSSVRAARSQGSCRPGRRRATGFSRVYPIGIRDGAVRAFPGRPAGDSVTR
ncbi:hypothetical protein B005_2268 [Nocardiopsis alba ATCC BAA-2165]|uniref:Uncharacterized protein n=1 Tax=Nocardiopsis alba (strain ATCC BAA-2165 / BE74) TaxID=1205910 RepID=J7LI57_NOCAA|nr:hypothetical protein B005_2268 [Nocardiopsis alba ATCC BAA-2165]